MCVQWVFMVGQNLREKGTNKERNSRRRGRRRLVDSGTLAHYSYTRSMKITNTCNKRNTPAPKKREMQLQSASRRDATPNVSGIDGGLKT